MHKIATLQRENRIIFEVAKESNLISANFFRYLAANENAFRSDTLGRLENASSVPLTRFDNQNTSIERTRKCGEKEAKKSAD